MHYTITNIPDDLDRALHERAAAEQKSLEAIILDLLARGLSIKVPPKRSSPICSEPNPNWKSDPEFEAAIREQGLIEWDEWSDGIMRRDLTGIAGQNLITPEMKAVFAEQRRIDPELWK